MNNKRIVWTQLQLQQTRMSLVNCAPRPRCMTQQSPFGILLSRACEQHGQSQARPNNAITTPEMLQTGVDSVCNSLDPHAVLRH